MSSKDPKDYNNWLDTFHRWLEDTKENESKRFDDFFDRSAAHWQAVKDMTQEEWTLFTNYIKRDIDTFYKDYKKDVNESTYLHTLKEGVWAELALLTDKSQIEWQELVQDFKHNGVYHAGEWLGMGELTCKQCGYKLSIVHPTEIPECPECGHIYYFREPLAP
ncbi:zinc ribbon-containing protein [Flocculibacter collagenilyticus]|uniref:zinc ribbon-containing protein n=1 Tax=Flocculibacter collagenilyticus TaxID=2744479 RepID=UPI0018F2CB9C|nr:hypothetical protein [Flocculibacter collagenilyticus]